MIDPQRALHRIYDQMALGPRYVGSAGHAQMHALLRRWLASADELTEQCFDERFFDQMVTCRNFRARFNGTLNERWLLGTHYDTRPWADRESDLGAQKLPVPGANDGGSGTAILAELCEELVKRRERPTLDLVFFDAEDWHEIDGKEVSLGARRYVDALAEDTRPDRVLIIDMVGGHDLMLDVDVNCQLHEPSFGWTLGVFQTGHALGLPCLSLKKPHPYKWLGCDHTPFQLAGIPTAVLIDIDYPEWHTVRDLPEACDAASLQQIGQLLEALLFTGRSPAP